MKKIVAHILVVIMIFCSIGDLSIVRGADSGFTISDTELFITDTTSSFNHKLIEYSQGTGEYVFDYFTEDSGQSDGMGNYINKEPWKIMLEFNNKSDDITDVKISAKNSNGSKQNKTFLVRQLVDGKWGDQVEYSETTMPVDAAKEKMGVVEVAGDGNVKFNKELNSNKKSDSLGFNDTQMYIELSDVKVLDSDGKIENLVIKVKKDGEKILFSTNGIKKGLVTCFRLKVGSGQQNPKYVFPGVDGLSIEPQHFVGDGNGGVRSVEILPDVTNSKKNPGERPGLLVSYNKIKQIKINADETFSFEEDIDTYATILRLDNGNMILDYSSDKTEVRYSGKQSGEGGTASNALETVNHQIRIKLASDEVAELLKSEGVTNVKDIIIPWDGLNYSQLLQDVEIATTLQSDGKTFTEKNENISKYTYLKYELGQTVDKKVYISLTPYKTTDNVEYYIFVDEKNKLAKDNLDFDKNSTVTGKSKYQKKVTADGNEDEMKIEIASQDKKYVRIVAVVDKVKKCYSQIMEIDTSKLIPEPEIPVDLKVSNIVVTPAKDDNTKNIPSSVKVDLKWNAPSNLIESYLENGELYYELILRDAQDSEDEKIVPGTSSKAAYSKIYKVSGDGQKLETIGTKDIGGTNQNGVFTVKDVYLKRESSVKNWEQLVTDNDSSIAQANAEKHWKAPYGDFYSNVKEVSTLEDKETGKVYYLSLRAVYVPESGDKLLASLESSLVPLPIDFTTTIIPVVNSLEYDKTTEMFNEKGNVIGEIGFDHVDISQYYSVMLEPVGLSLGKGTDKKYSGKYEFYLYKKGTIFNENNATEVLVEKEKIDLASYSEQLEKGIIRWDYSIDELLGKEDKNDFDERIKFDNLMPNQTYMIKVRVKLEPVDTDGQLQAERVSEFSKEFSFTTTTHANSPGTDERKPPTSGEIRVEPVEGSNSAAKVIWDKANFVKDDDMEVYYELIRSTKDIRQELTKEQLEDTVEKIVSGQNRTVGFATIDVNGTLNQNSKYMIYEGGKWTEVTPTQVVPTYTYDKIISQDEVEEYSFIDDKLAPNNVYYYYVRTVCVIKDGTEYSTVDGYYKVKSDWISANITTETINSPRNLKVERDTKYNDDTKHNIAISFEAEVPIAANIPNDFDFEIAIKSDNDEDYKIVSSKRGPLKKEETDLAGWTRFVYKITDLESNTRYSIKVRVVDKTTKIESFYSEIVITRTDYDEEDETDKENYEEYLKKLEAEINKIKSRPYWKLDDTGAYKYRTDYMKADLSHGSSYTLVNEDKDDDTQYYLPAEVIRYANENNTMIEMELESVKIVVRANTLLDDQKDIKEALEAIQDGAIQDYYVVIKSAQRAVDLKINGEKNISPKVQFEMSLVYMRQKDKEIESSIVKVLDSIVEDEKSNFSKKLKHKLEDGKLDIGYLDDLLQDSIDEIESELSKQASRIINKGYKKTQAISSINKSILISFQTEDVMGNAYYDKNGWAKVSCLSSGKEVMLEIGAWGWYIITGMQDLLETVPTLAPYQAFISKYGLTDIFKIDAYMVKTATTKQQMYGALAKVLGAPSNADYYIYLKNKGIKGLTKINMSEGIRQDEAIYLVMQGYEQLHRRSIQAINISNKQSVQNIGAFQSIYRDYVYGGVALKIVVPENNKVYPSRQITVETTIKMLYGIQK